MTIGDRGDGPLFFVVAGEPSGDALGERLMTALREEHDGPVRFAGVGGSGMTAAGLDSLFPMEELSVMGLAEVLPHVPRLLARIRETTQAALAARPDAVITIDSPGFSFRVARRLAGQGIPLIHYVAPTVWAWRPGRAKRIAGFLDHLLALLPFEPPYFHAHGLDCTFVGHSVLESGADQGNGQAFRARHQIAADTPLLCLLPGSRRSETGRLLPVLEATIAALQASRPGLRTVLPAVPTLAETIRDPVRGWPVPPVVVDGEVEKFDAFAAADAAIAASGTVTLELAMAAVPAVIVYRVHPASAWLARRLVRVPHVGLVNILLGREAIPELLQGQCRPDRLVDVVGGLLDDPTIRTGQAAAYEAALARLGPSDPAPSRRAARVVLDVAAAGR